MPDLPVVVAFTVSPLLAYSCGAHAPRRTGLAAVALLAAALQIAMGFSDFPNVEIYLSTLGPWWVGAEVRERRRLVGELHERTLQLEAEEAAFASLAVRRERARIARELHDIVAHHLAVIVIQAGAGRMAPGGEAATRMRDIRHAGDEALAEMARLIDIIDLEGDGGSGGMGRVDALAAEARSAGLRVTVVHLPVHVRPAPEVEDGACAVVREGLTNAMKHAPGAEVVVRLEVDGPDLKVEVRDGGAAAPPSLAASGARLGLTGMRERVEALGGELDAGPHGDGGWRVRARLPLAAAALVPAR